MSFTFIYNITHEDKIPSIIGLAPDDMTNQMTSLI